MPIVNRRSLVTALIAAAAIALLVGAWLRVDRVAKGAATIPVYPGAREGGGRTRYLPQLLSWDDRSSARVQRVFALPQDVGLLAIARHAHATLAAQGWYLVTPSDLERFENVQLVVWQRDPDERLDLTQLWPVSGMSRAQRLYGGVFPKAFLDAPLVVEWSWALDGPRSPRPALPQQPIVRPAPPPAPR